MIGFLLVESRLRLGKVAPQPVGLERLRCIYADTPVTLVMLQVVDLQAWRFDKTTGLPTNRRQGSTNDNLHSAIAWGTWLAMALIVTFILGMGNFACHSAVVRSGHPMFTAMAHDRLRLARIGSMVLEFALLCGALYAAQDGEWHWLWLYAGYTIINIGAAWTIVTGRM